MIGFIIMVTGVISDSFKESGNLLFLMASSIQLVKSKKPISLFFSTFTGIFPVFALSEGKLFTTFVTVVSETHWMENKEFCVLTRSEEWFWRIVVCYLKK